MSVPPSTWMLLNCTLVKTLKRIPKARNDLQTLIWKVGWKNKMCATANLDILKPHSGAALEAAAFCPLLLFSLTVACKTSQLLGNLFPLSVDCSQNVLYFWTSCWMQLFTASQHSIDNRTEMPLLLSFSSPCQSGGKLLCEQELRVVLYMNIFSVWIKAGLIIHSKTRQTAISC